MIKKPATTTGETSQGFHPIFSCFIRYLVLVLVIRKYLSLTDPILRLIKSWCLCSLVEKHCHTLQVPMKIILDY